MYKQSLEALRSQLFSFEEPTTPIKKKTGLIQARMEPDGLKPVQTTPYAEWLKSIRTITDEIKQTAPKRGTFASGLTKGLTKSQVEPEEKTYSDPTVENVPEENRDTFIRRRSKGPSYYSPRPSEADTFKGLIDTHEGGGDYDTLFQFSNKGGGAFSDVRVSEMTLGEVKDFASARGEGSYYQWSKENMPKGLIAYKKGLGSTPMGRYQFIGTTLKEVTKEMGLSDDTIFSPEVQDAMFEHYLKKTISRGSTVDEKIAHVRSAWEGFRNVDRATLENLIIKYEN